MRGAVARAVAFLAAAYGLLYIGSFFVVAATEHGDEEVSWASARVIAGQAVIPAFVVLAVLDVVGGLFILGAWALDGDR